MSKKRRKLSLAGVDGLIVLIVLVALSITLFEVFPLPWWVVLVPVCIGCGLALVIIGASIIHTTVKSYLKKGD